MKLLMPLICLCLSYSLSAQTNEQPRSVVYETPDTTHAIVAINFDAGKHLTNAGMWGIVGTSLTIAGGILIGVNAAKPYPGLLVGGAVMGGAGIGCNIAAMVELFRSGRYLSGDKKPDDF